MELYKPQGVLLHRWKQTPAVVQKRIMELSNLKIPPQHYWWGNSTLIMEAAAWNAAEAIITAGQKKLSSDRNGPPLAPLHFHKEKIMTKHTKVNQIMSTIPLKNSWEYNWSTINISQFVFFQAFGQDIYIMSCGNIRFILSIMPLKTQNTQAIC